MTGANAYHQAPDRLTEAPPGCPVHSRWSPLNDDYLADPYPIATRLQGDHPVFFAEEIGHVVVMRMEDIEAVFTRPDVFASTNVQDPVFPLAQAAADILAANDFDPVAVMSNRSEPDHARIRVYTRRGFSNRRLAALADYLRGRASDLLDAMVSAGPPAEYVQALAFPLPAEIVFRLLGFPAEDDAMIKAWCVDRKAFRGASRAPRSRPRSPRPCSTTGATAGHSSRRGGSSGPTTSAPSCSTPTTPIPTRPAAPASATGRSNPSSTASASPATTR